MTQATTRIRASSREKVYGPRETPSLAPDSARQLLI